MENSTEKRKGQTESIRPMSINDVDDLESSLAYVNFDGEDFNDPSIEECTESSELAQAIAHYTKVCTNKFVRRLQCMCVIFLRAYSC